MSRHFKIPNSQGTSTIIGDSLTMSLHYADNEPMLNHEETMLKWTNQRRQWLLKHSKFAGNGWRLGRSFDFFFFFYFSLIHFCSTDRWRLRRLCEAIGREAGDTERLIRSVRTTHTSVKTSGGRKRWRSQSFDLALCAFAHIKNNKQTYIQLNRYMNKERYQSNLLWNVFC